MTGYALAAAIVTAFSLHQLGLGPHPFEPGSPLSPFGYDMPPTAAM